MFVSPEKVIAPDEVNPPVDDNNPAAVIVPVPVVKIFPDVESESPAVVGEIVVVPLLRVKNPTVPEVFVVVIFPVQVSAPVVFVTVQPVDPEPPDNKTSPLEFINKPVFPVVTSLIANCELSTRI